MKQHNPAIRGLYAITPDLADTGSLCRMVQASIIGGAGIGMAYWFAYRRRA